MPMGKTNKTGVAARACGHSQAVVQLILTVALVCGIAAASIVISMGFARAQSAGGVSPADTSLVLGMLAGAIAVMSILSALAVRFIGRPRQH